MIFKIVFISLVFCANVFAKQPVSGNRYELLSGIRKDRNTKAFWDTKYSEKRYVYGKAPSSFLAHNYTFLPFGGKILDIGMGEGRNAVFLASKGYKVTGVEISSEAIRKARMLAREFEVRIDTALTPLEEYNIPEESLDGIICFYFVEKNLNERFMKWLKPGGIVIFEAFTERQKSVKGFDPSDNGALLKESELLKLFPGFRILKYEEPIHERDYRASIILQKTKESSSVFKKVKK